MLLEARSAQVIKLSAIKVHIRMLYMMCPVYEHSEMCNQAYKEEAFYTLWPDNKCNHMCQGLK